MGMLIVSKGQAVDMVRETARILDEIEGKLYLLPEPERFVWNRWVREAKARNRLYQARLGISDEFGFLPWLIAGGLAVGAAIGVWIRKEQEQARAKKEYLDCLEELQKQGYSAEEAAEICRGETATPIWVWMVIGAAAVSLLYLFASRK